jgi:hypothetical protein
MVLGRIPLQATPAPLLQVLHLKRETRRKLLILRDLHAATSDEPANEPATKHALV